LAKRDAQLDPFAPANPPAPPTDAAPPAKQSDQTAAAKMLELEQRFGRILRTTYNEAA